MGPYETAIENARKAYLKAIEAKKPSGIIVATIKEQSTKTLAKALDDAQAAKYEAMAAAHRAFYAGYTAHLAKIKDRSKDAGKELADVLTRAHGIYASALKDMFNDFLVDCAKQQKAEEAKKKDVDRYIADRNAMIKRLEDWKSSMETTSAEVHKLAAQAAEALADAKLPANVELIEDLTKVAQRMASRAKFAAQNCATRFDAFITKEYDKHRQEGSHIKSYGLVVADVSPHNKDTWRVMEARRAEVDGLVRSIGAEAAQVASGAARIEALGLSKDKLIAKLAVGAKSEAEQAKKEQSSMTSWMALSPTRDAADAVRKAKAEWESVPAKRPQLGAQNKSRLTKLAQTTENMNGAMARLDAAKKRLAETIDAEYREIAEIAPNLAGFDKAYHEAKKLHDKHKDGVDAVTQGLQPYLA